MWCSRWSQFNLISRMMYIFGGEKMNLWWWASHTQQGRGRRAISHLPSMFATSDDSNSTID
jgi:hypothetical protein